MRKKYVVELTRKQRRMLRTFTSSGWAPARQLTRARILLKADTGEEGPGWRDSPIARSLDVGTATVGRVRKRFAQGGVEAALVRRHSRRVYRRKLGKEAEARLIALATGNPPAGQTRWTFRLLADWMVRLGHVDRISHETARQALMRAGIRLG